MKTKFILHGGQLKFNVESNHLFFREVTKDMVDGDTLLFVGFARREE